MRSVPPCLPKLIVILLLVCWWPRLAFARDPSFEELLRSRAVIVHGIQCDQGQCVGVQLPDMPKNQIFMLDGGPPHAWSVVKAYFDRIGVNEVAGALLNHTHYDHALGFGPMGLLLPIRRFFGPWAEDRIPLSAAAAMANGRPDLSRDPSAQNRAEYRLAAADGVNDKIQIGANAQLEVLWPRAQTGGVALPDRNFECVVTRFSYSPPDGSRPATFLCDGDLMSEVADILAMDDPEKLQVDFSFLSHHGSGANTNPNYIWAQRGESSEAIDLSNAGVLRAELSRGVALHELPRELSVLQRRLNHAWLNARLKPDRSDKAQTLRDTVGEIERKHGTAHLRIMEKFAEAFVGEAMRRIDRGFQLPVAIISSGPNNPYGHPNPNVDAWAATMGGMLVYHTTEPTGQLQHVVRYRRVDEAGNFIDPFWRTHLVREPAVLPAVSVPEWMEDDPNDRPYDWRARIANGFFELSPEREHEKHIVAASDMHHLRSTSLAQLQHVFRTDAARPVFRGRGKYLAAIPEDPKEFPRWLQEQMRQHPELMQHQILGDPRLSFVTLYTRIIEPKQRAFRLWHEVRRYRR